MNDNEKISIGLVTSMIEILNAYAKQKRDISNARSHASVRLDELEFDKKLVTHEEREQLESRLRVRFDSAESYIDNQIADASVAFNFSCHFREQ